MNDVTKNNLQEQELKASKQTINQLLGFPEDTAVEDYLNYQDSHVFKSSSCGNFRMLSYQGIADLFY